MGTKNVTTTSNQTQQQQSGSNAGTSTFNFDPTSLSQMNSWKSQLFPQLSSMFSNPMGSPFFNQQLQASTKAASGLAGRNMGNALSQFNSSGIGSGSMNSGLRSSLMGGLNRYSSGLQFQGFNNAVNNAQTNMWNSAQLGSSLFQPFQTGASTTGNYTGNSSGTSNGTQTQTTGGLGTWLPQLVGAGLGLASGGLTGGLSSMTGGIPSGANSLINQSIPTSMPSGFFNGMLQQPQSSSSSYPSNPFLPGGSV